MAGDLGERSMVGQWVCNSLPKYGGFGIVANAVLGAAQRSGILPVVVIKLLLGKEVPYRRRMALTVAVGWPSSRLFIFGQSLPGKALPNVV